jgi:hypothetical protein
MRAFVATSVALAVVMLLASAWPTSEGFAAPPSGGAACGPATCGALDPVDDPAYNMREVAKQTLLLEQHLADPRKLCRACSVKHLLLCCGLLEEAAWMAGTRGGAYPMLDESSREYADLLATWPWRERGADVPDARRTEILAQLRARRRALVDAYMMSD